MIVPGGGFLPPSSRVPRVYPGEGMVLDEIDSCIMNDINCIKRDQSLTHATKNFP